MNVSTPEPLPAGEAVTELAARKCLTENQIAAAAKFRALYFELAAARALLGDRHYRLVVSLIGQDHSLTEVTGNKRGRLTMVDNLRASLDDLAALWGLAARRRPRNGGE
ncbi:hypothetical protein [Mesorhizobium sp.]|uniref:hypothetical protein n=1 Tax=Mesorhizobium sp. TaxID=1871066 RepID=UPI0025DC7041|nr:hypothetical protein [Mesorhizobium sp.]